MVKLEDIPQLLDKAIDCLEEKKDFWEIPALLEIEGAMKQRIHRDGLDYQGRRFNEGIRWKEPRTGDYNSIYAKKRNENGRQTNKKDLNATDTLINSYGVGKLNGKNVLEFQDDINQQKAGYLEELHRKEIFRPSQDELDDAVEILLENFEEQAEDCFSINLPR